MKKNLLFLAILLTTSNTSFAQNRAIARGAEPGELYLTGSWYGIYSPSVPLDYDTLLMATYRLTENGKKLTIQHYIDTSTEESPPGSVMQPAYILADATQGVLYNKCLYSKNSYQYTSLWTSFDYGENWIFREENLGSKSYTPANFEGLLYRGGADGIFKSEDFGNTFIKFDIVGVGMEPGLQYGEGWRAWTTNLFQGKIFHSYDFFETYSESPIDSQFMFGSIQGISPDVYRGGKEGEVYISSWFPDGTYKASFSTDTGYTFRHVYVSEMYALDISYPIIFMSDREPGVFYIIRRYKVEDANPWGWHMKICIEYYKDYGDILEATFCHDIIKGYEYEEVICDNTIYLNSKVVNQNSIQLQWSNSADNSLIRGYHVYRNNMRITSQLLTDTIYIDENLLKGDYEYYVRTYYKIGCTSDASNKVEETIKIGVNEMEKAEKIVIYPNPTTGKLRVTSDELQVESIEIFDVYGRKLSSNHHITSSSHQKIDISHLQAGVYFVKITTEKGIITKKIVKH